jgi:hypothetical protein
MSGSSWGGVAAAAVTMLLTQNYDLYTKQTMQKYVSKRRTTRHTLLLATLQAPCAPSQSVAHHYKAVLPWPGIRASMRQNRLS